MSYPYRQKPRASQLLLMKRLYRDKRVGAFWEMGAGKTKPVLDFIGTMLYHRKLARVLIIVPLKLIDGVWEPQIEEQWPDLPMLRYEILRPDTYKKGAWRESPVVITNFDYARTMTKELMEWAPDLIVIDESHKIKNPHSRQSKMAHRLGNVCRYAIILTGTPIGNHPLDLWSQFKFLVPGLLQPSYREFQQEYSVFGGFGGKEFKKYKNLPQLGEVLRPYTYALKASEVTELPKTNWIEMPVEMGEKARKTYDSMEKDFIAWVSKERVIQAPIVLAKMTKLSQIAGGFIRDTEKGVDYPVHRAKLEVLEGIVDDLKASDVERIVIFARFLWEIDEIKKVLAPNWVVYEMSGRIKSEDQRKLARNLFNSSGGVMLCQIASGSLGENYQAANYCIFYSMDYSQINFYQAWKRIHRSGQKKPCFYYLLLCKATIDRTVYRALKAKRDIAKMVIQHIRGDK